MNSLIPRLSCLLHLKLPLPLLARLLLARLRAAATGRLRAARCPHTLALDWQGGVTWTTKATGPTPTTSTASRASTGRATIAVRRSSVPLVQHAAVHAYARSAPRNLPPPLSHAHGNRNPVEHASASKTKQNIRTTLLQACRVPLRTACPPHLSPLVSCVWEPLSLRRAALARGRRVFDAAQRERGPGDPRGRPGLRERAAHVGQLPHGQPGRHGSVRRQGQPRLQLRRRARRRHGVRVAAVPRASLFKTSSELSRSSYQTSTPRALFEST